MLASSPKNQKGRQTESDLIKAALINFLAAFLLIVSYRQAQNPALIPRFTFTTNLK